mgnify:CR=1 FL=1
MLIMLVVLIPSAYFLGQQQGTVTTRTVTETVIVPVTEAVIVPAPTPIEQVVDNAARLLDKFIYRTGLPLTFRFVDGPYLRPKSWLIDTSLQNIYLLPPPFIGVPPLKDSRTLAQSILSLDGFAKTFQLEELKSDFLSTVEAELQENLHDHDFALQVAWSVKDAAYEFPSIIIVDQFSLQPKFDSFMRFVGLEDSAETPQFEVKYATVLSQNAQSGYQKKELSWPMPSIFDKVVLEAYGVVEVRLSTAGVPAIYYDLTIDFKSGFHGGIVDIFLRSLYAGQNPLLLLWEPQMALGEPRDQPLRIGSQLIDITLSSWLLAVNGTVLDVQQRPIVSIEDSKTKTEIDAIYSANSVLELIQRRAPEFLRSGSRLLVSGQLSSASVTGKIDFVAYVALVASWNWKVLDYSKIHVSYP